MSAIDAVVEVLSERDEFLADCRDPERVPQRMALVYRVLAEAEASAVDEAYTDMLSDLIREMSAVHAEGLAHQKAGH